MRDLLGKPITILVQLLNEHTDLTPNQVSLVGALVASSPALYKLIVESPKHELSKTTNLILACISLIGVSIDGIDGSLARYQETIGKKNGHSQEVGQLVDGLLDRYQEALNAITYLVTLNRSGYDVATTIQKLVSITNPLSSFLRAYAESQGKSMPENGTNLLEFFGTRTGRVILGSMSFLPREQKTLHHLIPMLQLAGNLMTINKRAAILFSDQKQHQISKSDRDKAKTRKMYYGAAVVMTALATLYVSKKLSK